MQRAAIYFLGAITLLAFCGTLRAQDFFWGNPKNSASTTPNFSSSRPATNIGAVRKEPMKPESMRPEAGPRTLATGFESPIDSAVQPIASGYSSAGERFPTAQAYRIIPRPMTDHVGKTLPYSATVQASPTPSLQTQPTRPYAYGWFGPQETPQWHRHFGYQSRYTQWTLK